MKAKIAAQFTVLLLSAFFFINVCYAHDVSRPLHHKLTPVYIQMFLINISDVNTAEQKFVGNLYLEAHWVDKRLIDPKKQSVTLPVSQVWTPRLQISNQQHLTATFPEVVTVDQKGNVTYKQRYWGGFSQPFNLRQFPFDTQVFTIQLISVDSDAHKKVVLKTYKAKGSGMSESLSLPEWKITSWNMQGKMMHFVKGGLGFPAMTFSVTAQRRLGYYIIVFIIPLALIVLMSWIAFFICIKEVNIRLTITVTSMLTLVAFRFIVGVNLPKVSYLTKLDVLILASTLQVFFSLILTTVISLLMHIGKSTLAERVNTWSRWVLLCFFLLTMLYTFLS